MVSDGFPDINYLLQLHIRHTQQQQFVFSRLDEGFICGVILLKEIKGSVAQSSSSGL